MILLIRFFLVSLIVYLIVRSFLSYGKTGEDQKQNRRSEDKNFKQDRKVSKETGEYVDYEEVD
jgi:large-conductance mechanosensitive channel